MDQMNGLDGAHADMETALEQGGDEDAARLRFYERLADTQLCVLLTEDAQGDQMSPEVFDLADGQFILVFDSEERLAEFSGRVVPYAALSGRMIVQLLAGQGIGLGVNLDVAPSQILIPAEAIDWLGQTLAHAPDEVEAGLSEFVPPKGLPDDLLRALDAKLSGAVGLATSAYLVGVRYDNGGTGYLLGFVDAKDHAHDALAKAAGEALTFSGIEAGVMDVGFFASGDPVADKLTAVGMRYDLPELQQPKVYAPQKPGGDPDNPPKLK